MDKITIERETLQAALDALEPIAYEGDDWMARRVRAVRDELRAALAAQPAGTVSVDVIRAAYDKTFGPATIEHYYVTAGMFAQEIARAVLAAPAPAPAAVPPGYALVPVEPTQAMEQAFYPSILRHGKHNFYPVWKDLIVAAGDKT